ncbi:hypothetical protein LIER_38111 [Lithospermum erythrorhizon]|uniref:DUF4283 domain-containing protein n=1 Tax=Lithospermum erythrorhizon TaxID=34254 RepID=A0AAV3PWZ4_LITER
MDKGDNGSKPPDVDASGSERVGGENSGVAPTRATYASVMGKAPSSYQRMDLTFVSPTLVEGKPLVELPTSVVMVGAEKWKHTIIGYVLGYNPNFGEMAGFVKNRWSEFGKIKLYHMDKGPFVFQLESEELKLMVLEKGLWSFWRRPLMLRPWKIGVPLYEDRTTSEQHHLTYARVCIEISVDNELFDELPVKYSSGQQFFQKVAYEWVPLKCRRFGHAETSCQAAQMYVPKRKAEVVVGEGNLDAFGGESFKAAGGSFSEYTEVGNQKDSGLAQKELSVQSSMLIGVVNVPTSPTDGTYAQSVQAELGKGLPSPIVEGSEERDFSPKSYASMVTPMIHMKQAKGTKGVNNNIKSSLKASTTHSFAHR